jgi:hypothetical protein
LLLTTNNLAIVSVARDEGTVHASDCSNIAWVAAERRAAMFGRAGRILTDR